MRVRVCVCLRVSSEGRCCVCVRACFVCLRNKRRRLRVHVCVLRVILPTIYSGRRFHRFPCIFRCKWVGAPVDVCPCACVFVCVCVCQVKEAFACVGVIVLLVCKMKRGVCVRVCALLRIYASCIYSGHHSPSTFGCKLAGAPGGVDPAEGRSHSSFFLEGGGGRAQQTKCTCEAYGGGLGSVVIASHDRVPVCCVLCLVLVGITLIYRCLDLFVVYF